MATYRTIRMDFWNDPYVEGMEPQDKLLYVYLFSSPHTNNLGVLTVSRRKIAFETGLTEEGVAAGLAALERLQVPTRRDRRARDPTYRHGGKP